MDLLISVLVTPATQLYIYLIPSSNDLIKQSYTLQFLKAQIYIY